MALLKRLQGGLGEVWELQLSQEFIHSHKYPLLSALDYLIFLEKLEGTVHYTGLTHRPLSTMAKSM